MHAAGATRYLTYTLADEVFALAIGKVREVLDFAGITRVPRMPEFNIEPPPRIGSSLHTEYTVPVV